MGRTWKWVGIGVGGLLILALLAGLLLPALVSLERYRTLLAGRVSRALGREVSLGALSVSLWRGLGAEAKGVRIAQAPGFGEAPLLTADGLRLRVQFLPLLRGQIKVSSLALERPRILLLRGPDGRWGVEDLLRGGAAPAPPRSAPEAPRTGRGSAPAAAVLISEVSIRDGEVRLAKLGRSGPVALGLTGLQLRLRQGTLADPVEVESRADLASPGGGSIESTGRIQLADPEVPVLDLLVKLSGVPASTWQSLMPGEAGGTRLSGTVSGEVKLDGPLPRLGFDGRLDLAGVGLSIGERFEKAEREKAALVFRGRREGVGLQVSAWRLEAKGDALEGTLRLADLARPHVSFTASSPRLDLDRILAKPKGAHAWFFPATAWAAVLPAAKTAEAVGLSADGTLRIAELAYAGLVWKGFEADLAYRGGILRISRLVAQLLTGSLRGQGEVDFRPRMPRVNLVSEIENLPTEPLVKALKLGAWRLESRLNLTSRISFVGLGLAELLGSAAGQGELRLAEGRLRDYPPLDRLAEVIAPVLASQGVRTRLHEFKELRGSYTVAGGILRSQNLTLVKPEGTITMSGSLGLLDRSLNAEVVARLGRSLVEAKLSGTTDRPIVVPRLDRLQRKLETEIDKLVPEEQGRGLKDLFRRFFGR